MIPEVIHLAISFDQNYLTPFYVLATSIFLNNKESKFRIHAIVTGLSEQQKEHIQDYVNKHQSEVSFYAIDADIVNKLVIPKNSYFTVAAYYRLFFPSLVPDSVKKLLYLDTDIVVANNLSELYQTDIGTYPLGAVPEVNATPNRPDLGIHEIGNYFNSGVLLINVPEWKKQEISEKAIKFIQDFPEKIVWVDQDALNVVLKNNYVKLSPRFNVIPFDIPKNLPKSKYQEFLSDKVIIHYTLKEHKPWNIKGKNKFRYLYHNYLQQSPRRNDKRYTNTEFTVDTFKAVAKVFVLETLINRPKLANSVSKVIGRNISNWL